MPLLSDTMKEGVIAEWHKKVGDTVKSDDIIAEVETDKATMEVMPYVDGTLLYIGVERGKGVPVNGIMAIIGKPGENFQPILDAEKGGNATPSPGPATPVQPAAAPPPTVETPQPAAQLTSWPDVNSIFGNAGQPEKEMPATENPQKQAENEAQNSPAAENKDNGPACKG